MLFVASHNSTLEGFTLPPGGFGLGDESANIRSDAARDGSGGRDWGPVAPLTVPVFDRVGLAANNLDASNTKTVLAAARNLTSGLHFSSARLQARKLCKRPAERGLIVVGRFFIIWGR
jgi:hypothetical protein